MSDLNKAEICKSCWDCKHCYKTGTAGRVECEKEGREIEDPEGVPDWCPVNNAVEAAKRIVKAMVVSFIDHLNDQRIYLVREPGNESIIDDELEKLIDNYVKGVK